MRLFLFILLFAYILNGVQIQAAIPQKVTLLCHYMQWFHYRTENGTRRRNHWEHIGKHMHNPDRFDSKHTHDIYSVLYPRIGIYDSLDPAVIDYHILSAKTAGISVFTVDWYHNTREQFEQLLDQAEKLNFQVSICYEEKTCFPDWVRNRAGIYCREDAIQYAVNDFRYFRNLFDRKGYFKKNKRPLVMVFGFVWPRPKGWGPKNGEWRFTAQEWRRILKDSGCSDVELLLQQFRCHENKFNSFLWLTPEVYYPQGEKIVREKKIDFYVGSINPGFDDRGSDGWNCGARVGLPNLGMEQMEKFLNYADHSSCDIFQIVTWNDYAEGSCVEPTLQYGQLYLERIGQWHAKRNQLKWKAGVTILPYRYFVLRKMLGKSATSALRAMLADGKYEQAENEIKRLSKGRNIPLALTADVEFPEYIRNTPQAAASVPKVPKEKFLLVVLAGQSNMSGRGKILPQDRVPDKRILMLTEDGTWVPAVDPVHFDIRKAGVGPGRSFAKRLADANPGCIIGLVPTAVGNSSLTHFQPDEIHPGTRIRIYNDLIDRTKYAMRFGTLKAILFHHGESALDPKDAPVYGKNFTALIRKIRKDLNQVNVPVIAGEIQYGHGSNAWKQVNDGLRKFASEEPRTGFVSTEGLKLFDGTHFDRGSQIKLGERYYQTYLKTESQPKKAIPENLLKNPVFKVEKDGKKILGWSHELYRKGPLHFETINGQLRVIPENGRVVVALFGKFQHKPGMKRLRFSVYASGNGTFRLHAISGQWKKLSSWGNKANLSSPIFTLSRQMKCYHFDFELPKEKHPVNVRIDCDTSLPVLVAEPTLTTIE